VRGELSVEERPALQVRAHLVLRLAVLVEHEGGVHLDPAARLEGRLDGDRPREVDVDARGLRQGGKPVGETIEQHRRRHRRDALGDDGLRRGQEHDRLLEQASLAHEQLVLHAALDVVTGIGLVDHEPDQVDDRLWQVAVDRDPAAQVAGVPAVAHPRHVMDDLEVDSLPVRQVDERTRARAGGLDRLPRHLLDPLGRHERGAPEGVVALGERARARQQLLQPLVHLGERGLVGAARPQLVAGLDLVGIRPRLAREHAREGVQCPHLVAQPAVAELVAERAGGGGELHRGDRLRRVDGGNQLGRAEVGVDDLVGVAAELEAQTQVALDVGISVHPARAYPRGA
jgi:hypothetical protein